LSSALPPTSPSTTVLIVANRQRSCRINLRRFRQAVAFLLHRLLQAAQFDLGFYFVTTPEMARLNETFLNHQGSTDVITFDYGPEPSSAASPAQTAAPPPCPALHGEIFICAEEALRQARRFRTTWQSELVRYAVHGVLHLAGYDDRTAGVRRRMKKLEGSLLRKLAGQFRFDRLGAIGIARPTQRRRRLPRA